MGGIKDHRAAQGLELGQAPVIHHQGVVAKAAAPFSQPEAAAGGIQARFRHLVHHLGHVPGGQKLALFHIHHLLCASHGLGGGFQQIGLAAEEGWDLEHIHDLGGGSGLVAFVDVGEHRHPKALAHLLEDFEALIGARPPIGLAGAAVGLVEAGFEHVTDAQLLADAAHLLGHLQHQIPALDHTGPGDQGEGLGAHGLGAAAAEAA